MFLPHPRVKVNIAGSLRDREVACSASDRQGSNFESCVWRTVSSQSSHHPQEVLLAQFSLYVHKGGLKPDSFHFTGWWCRVSGHSDTNVVFADVTSVAVVLVTFRFRVMFYALFMFVAECCWCWLQVCSVFFQVSSESSFCDFMTVVTELGQLFFTSTLCFSMSSLAAVSADYFIGTVFYDMSCAKASIASSVGAWFYRALVAGVWCLPTMSALCFSIVTEYSYVVFSCFQFCRDRSVYVDDLYIACSCLHLGAFYCPHPHTATYHITISG